MARLDLRIMHVKPGAPTKVWDAKLMDSRRDVRVFPNGAQGDSTEFIEIVVLRNDSDYPQAIPRWSLEDPKPTVKLSKSRRKKLLRRKLNAAKQKKDL